MIIHKLIGVASKIKLGGGNDEWNKKLGGPVHIVSFFEKYLSFYNKKNGGGAGPPPQLTMSATPMHKFIGRS